MVTLVGFCLVFILLVSLVFVLKLFGVIMQPKAKAAKIEPKKEAVASLKESPAGSERSADVTAAIAMALHLYYNGVHDEEPTQITIKKVERRYSPWNSKLYGMNNLHR